MCKHLHIQIHLPQRENQYLNFLRFLTCFDLCSVIEGEMWLGFVNWFWWDCCSALFKLSFSQSKKFQNILMQFNVISHISLSWKGGWVDSCHIRLRSVIWAYAELPRNIRIGTHRLPTTDVIIMTNTPETADLNTERDFFDIITQ